MSQFEAVGDWRWWAHDRLGMFIHWGLYALPARHEWVRHHERISNEDYQHYFDHFDPDLYDPAAWAAAARQAGMKYVVLTTKHHEGFCLWDSRYTDYKVTNTPYGRDLLHPFVDAFRAEGLKVGFYHSLIDWHHPEFPVDRIHPMRDDADGTRRQRQRDVRKYADYLHNQVRELLTEFGEIDYLFFDFSYPGRGRQGPRRLADPRSCCAWCASLQPGILVNDRLDLLDVPGGWDFARRSSSWCATASGEWAARRCGRPARPSPAPGAITATRPPGRAPRNCSDAHRHGQQGRQPAAQRGPHRPRRVRRPRPERLAGMGEWMRRHGRAIYGCTRAPEGFSTPQDCRLTYNPETNRLYVHLFNWPIGSLHLPGLAGKVTYAQLLNDASEVRMSTAALHGGEWGGAGGDLLTLALPIVRPDVAVPVIELFLK